MHIRFYVQVFVHMYFTRATYNILHNGLRTRHAFLT